MIDVAADDHPEIKSLPHEVRHVARNAIANFVEALVHKQFSKKPELIELNLRVLHRGLALGQQPAQERSA